MQDYLDV
jgi:hypothetical protein